MSYGKRSTAALYLGTMLIFPTFLVLDALVDNQVVYLHNSNISALIST